MIAISFTGNMSDTEVVETMAAMHTVIGVAGKTTRYWYADSKEIPMVVRSPVERKTATVGMIILAYKMVERAKELVYHEKEEYTNTSGEYKTKFIRNKYGNWDPVESV
jgi:hypothetical protein